MSRSGRTDTPDAGPGVQHIGRDLEATSNAPAWIAQGIGGRELTAELAAPGQPPAVEDESQAHLEHWRYAGRGIDSQGKRHERWHDQRAAGLLTYKPHPGGYVIGAWYAVQVERNGDRVSLYSKPGPRYLQPQRDELAARWELTDRAADAEQARNRAEANAGKASALDAVTGPLATAAAMCRTRAERDALMALCASVVYRPTR